MRAESVCNIPHFVIGGAMKAGTTTISEVLKEHPRVFMPNMKEPHFFCNLEQIYSFPGRKDGRLSYAIQTEKEYMGLFKSANGRLTGEATATYLFDPQSPEKIHSFNPDVKLIFALRDPVKRAYSAYNFTAMKDFETISFDEVCRQELSGGRDHYYYDARYLHSGLYGECLKRWLKFFRRDQILVVFMENLSKESEWNRIFSFLGIETPYSLPIDKQSNATVSLPNKFDRKLWSLMASDNWLKRLITKPLKDNHIEVAKNLARKYLEKRGQKVERLPEEKYLEYREFFLNDTRVLVSLLGEDRSHPWAGLYLAESV